MLKAAIALDRALSSLQEQTANKALKKVIGALKDTVTSGQPLSAGLRQYQKIFGDLFINMVAAGEISGKLEESLQRLYVQLKKDYDLKSKVKGALAYPAFVILTMLSIGTTVMIYVIPKLIPLFESFGTTLPLSTRILVGISKFIISYGAWLAIALVISGVIFVRLVQKRFRRHWHVFLLAIPLVNTLLKKINIARFARTLSTLLSTDLLVVDALNITSRTLGNILYRESVLKSAEGIKRGIPIASAIKEYPKLFPATVYTMVSVGEESGNLAQLLEEVAAFYEESVDEITKNLSTLIEPILIVLLGIAVGGMAIAILTPMYALMQQI
ncbi:MAG: Type II secretion system protein [Parcubacteria group bacterium GW2011_GWA2_47_26]|nr:MAG: Type II secretion system protein [Parcubacteria group bacterium GW2011_GWA2_47_26]